MAHPRRLESPELDIRGMILAHDGIPMDGHVGGIALDKDSAAAPLGAAIACDDTSTDLAIEFPVNIARYVDEVKALGSVPMLVTPLTRRMFREGVLKNDLVPWADAIRLVAKDKSVQLIDLNEKSAAAVAAMGSVEADTLAEEPPGQSTPSRFDHTHLGPKGASLFARMMARELIGAVPEMATHIDRTKLAQ